MTGFWPTFKKELFSYLVNPLGYLILLLLYAFRGLEIGGQIVVASRVPFAEDQFVASYLLGNSSYLLLILVPPILTMRCFAEERRTGSLEVLMTAPVTEAGVVLGKWLAALTFFAGLWLPSVPILAILQGDGFVGGELLTAPLFASLFGLLLVGALFLAIGCFTSSLSDNQLLASLSAIVVVLGLLFGPQIGQRGILNARVERASLEESGFVHDTLVWLTDELFDPVLAQIHVGQHLGQWFGRGLVNTGHVAFYLAGIACFLFLTVRSLESRRLA